MRTDIRRTLILCLTLCLVLGFYSSLYAHDNGYYRVVSVVDGDTFDLEDGSRVRLIGVNTPEIGEKCASEAKERLNDLIYGETVYLEKDVSETDQYGRLLRYVWIDNVFVNERIVYDGYAHAVEYPPDTKYAAQFAEAEESADSADRGCLWAVSCPSNCYVHITATGSKYHAAGCKYLSNSDYLICKDDAIAQGYTKCSVCGGSCDGSSSGSDGSGSGGGGCFISTTSAEMLATSNRHND